MNGVVQAIHRMHEAGLLWLIAAAVLFLVGASRFNGAGMKVLAEIGVGGAIAAIAMTIAFLR